MDQKKTKGASNLREASSKKQRSAHDLDLILLILEENPPLKRRVLKFMETSVGAQAAPPGRPGPGGK